MYTQNQYDIVDTEELICFLKTQLPICNNINTYDTININLALLERKLKELYSKESQTKC